MQRKKATDSLSSTGNVTCRISIWKLTKLKCLQPKKLESLIDNLGFITKIISSRFIAINSFFLVLVKIKV